ncbi:MAG: RNA polymerase sigma-70 factor (ECF subfamily) [Verrucomicrobiales bacterium]
MSDAGHLPDDKPSDVNESPPESPDEEIVAQLTAIQLPLRLYVQSLLAGESALGDVVQQANATIWRKRSDFTLGTNFKAWTFSIARYEVLNFRKRQARDARLVFSAELEETFAEEIAEQSVDLNHRHAALRCCLDKLRDKDRELLLHRYSSSGTLADFAEKNGRSVSGLKVTLHRLRNALSGCIDGQLRTGRTGQGGAEA